MSISDCPVAGAPIAGGATAAAPAPPAPPPPSARRRGVILALMMPPQGTSSIAVAGDSLFSNVQWLLHGDSVDATTGAVVDSSSHGYTFTANRPTYGPTASTSVKKYGTASFDYSANSVNHYIAPSGAASSGASIGSQQFCLEAWVYLVAYPAANAGIVSSYYSTGSNRSYELLVDSAGGLSFRASVDGVNQAVSASGPAAVPLGVWTHICAERNGTNLGVAVNGTFGTLVADARAYKASSTFSIGRVPDLAWPLNGYLQEIRHTVGTNRYGLATFTPPAARFPDS